MLLIYSKSALSLISGSWNCVLSTSERPRCTAFSSRYLRSISQLRMRMFLFCCSWNACSFPAVVSGFRYTSLRGRWPRETTWVVSLDAKTFSKGREHRFGPAGLRFRMAEAAFRPLFRSTDFNTILGVSLAACCCCTDCIFSLRFSLGDAEVWFSPSCDAEGVPETSRGVCWTSCRLTSTRLTTTGLGAGGAWAPEAPDVVATAACVFRCCCRRLHLGAETEKYECSISFGLKPAGLEIQCSWLQNYWSILRRTKRFNRAKFFSD